MDIVWARKHFTVVGERLVRELRGASCLELEEVIARKISLLQNHLENWSLIKKN